MSDNERSVEEMTIDELIERSSLGTPEAKAIRARTPPGVAAVIVAASNLIGDRDRRIAELEAEVERDHEARRSFMVAATEFGHVLEDQKTPEGVVAMARAAHYVSTYCMHEAHGQCRLTCKTCRQPCLCPCHEGTR